MEHQKRGRRRYEERHENLDRWIISYADFMTLLFAVFVMLYAISSMNISKYRFLSQVISEAFLGKMVNRDDGLTASQRAPFNNLQAPIAVPVPAIQEPPKNLSPELQRQIQERLQQLEKIYNNLSTQFHDLIQKDQVHIVHQPNGVVIDINATLLFQSGSATLMPDALHIIDQVGKALAEVPYTVQVNGFTDNVPIHNNQFDSNWDLSAMRAISVVKRFVDDGIAPDRLVGAGYGEYHPIKPNNSAENMARNRRVSIIVVAPDREAKLGEVPLLNGAVQPEDAAPPLVTAPEVPPKTGDTP